MIPLLLGVLAHGHFYEFCLELFFYAAELGFCGRSLFPALLLDGDDFVQGGDQGLIGVLEGVDLNDPTFGLPGGLDGGGLEGVGVFPEELVGHVCDLALGLGSLHGVLDSEGDDHLVFPERDGVNDG